MLLPLYLLVRKDGFQVGIISGISSKLNERFCINGTIGYLGYRDKYWGEEGLGVHLNSSDLKFGFYYLF
ncbi:hypothetical protein DW228_05985 [Bacteroides fragilis]|uniref:Uncharacterized protein n=1 Tax=Bacteroides fragilis TaxID=817 RepID=A0A396C9N4_BACFG|nr:hypothetical protein DW228_05985 [Bacteroides fragilis]